LKVSVGVSGISGVPADCRARLRCVIQGAPLPSGAGLWSFRELSALKRAANAKAGFHFRRKLQNVALAAHKGSTRACADALEFLAPFPSWPPLPFCRILPVTQGYTCAAVKKPSAGAGGRAVVCAQDGAGAITTGQREYSRSAAHDVETLQRPHSRVAFITQRYIFLRRFGLRFVRGQTAR
jgi:hypothetical protein